MNQRKFIRTRIQKHRSNSRNGSAVAGASFLGWAAVPIAAATWNSSRVLGIAALLCFIAVIALAVPAIFDYWRRWRHNREMSVILRSNKQQIEQPSTTRQVEAMKKTENIPQTPLGWSSEDEAPAATPAPSQQKSILIADDDPVVVLALSRRLQHLGYTVFRSPDAMHALMGTMKARPDLVILDVMMPSGNGLAVCEMMASDPQYADIPVIIHSVISDEATQDRCRRLGAHYVEKSARSWAQIRDLVESLLGEEQATEKPRVEKPWKSRKSTMDTLSEKKKKEQKASVKNVKKDIAEDSKNKKKDEKQPGVQPPPAAAVESTSSQQGPSRVICIENPKDRLEFVDQQLSALGLQVVRTSDLEEGFWMCFTERPKAVVVQTSVRDASVSKLFKDLATHPVTRSLPVLWIDESKTMDEGRMSDAANILVLKYPMDWEMFLVHLEEVLPEFGHEGSELWGQPESTVSEEVAEEPPASELDHAVFAVDHKPLKVLCIDDDPVLTRSIVMHLVPYGIQVETAEDGTQGYLLATSELPDLILLDLMMPHGDGNYALGKLKDNSRTCNIPVIVLTIEVSPATRRRMFALGADAFVDKPVDWEKLYTEMGRCVQLPEKLLEEYHLPEQLTIEPI